jgi:uncharacterized coiled-coil protein SlyX
MPFVIGAIGGALGIGAASGLAGFAGTFVGGVLVNLATSVALSALSAAIAGKPKAPPPVGLRTQHVMTGGVNPEGFILGRYATSGAFACPPLSHTGSGRLPNGYLTYVIELAGSPGHQLETLILNGEEVEILDPAPEGDATRIFGNKIGGRFEGKAWIRYYDGTQTAADPFLLDRFPAPHVRPWSADMVGDGICYAVVTFYYDREIFQGWPQCRFVLTGRPLYDPRADSTAGGEGAQRWNDPATWAPSHNPAVQVYNVLRGIDLPGGWVWGGGIAADDLPYAVWAGAMDRCDALVDDGDGGTEAAYRAGFEILADDEPFEVIDELLRGCAGAVAESGGVWSIRVGGPALPVLFITDDDIMGEAAVEFTPFPALDEVYNGISGTYIDPETLWESRDAAPIYNSAWEAEDGDRRLMATVQLAAVPYPVQVTRVMNALIADHRRMIRHVATLPPDAFAVEALDVIAWTSAANGYDAKAFEVMEVRRDLQAGRVQVTLREVDPDDYDVPEGLTRPVAPDLRPLRADVQGVPGWDVAGVEILDAAGNPRRPGVLVTWTASEIADARGVRVAIRRAVDAGEGDEQPVQAVNAGGAVFEVLPGVAYQARARLVADRPTEWTEWESVTAPDIRLGLADMQDDVAADLSSLHDWIDGGVTDLPAALDALTDQIIAETVARVADARLSADRWREQRDTIRALVADVVELASASHSAREEIRQALTVQLGDLGASFAQQIVVLADADQAAAIRLTDLEASSSDLSAQINQVEVARVAGDDALAALIAEISVGSAVQFDHAAIWYFDATVEGWTGSPDAPTTATAGWLRPGTDSSVISPDVAVAGGSYAQVRARLRRGGAPVWQGWLWWARPSEDWDTGRRITISEPAWDDDIAILTANPEWTGEIERIRFDLTDGTDGTDYVEFDWIAIGRPAPGASSADLLTEQQARIDGDSALASDLTALGARVDDAETGLAGNADAIDALDVRVEATETGLAVQGEAITALEGQVTDPATGLAALADAIDQITIDAGVQDDAQFAQAQTLRALQAAIRGVAAEGIEAAARDQTRQQAVRDYVAEAAQTLNARVDLTDGEVAIIAEAVTLLQAAIPDLATADALDALTATVTAQGGTITSQGSAITSLTNSLEDKADSSALTALDSRVSSAEGTITAQGEAITATNASLDALALDVGTKAEASALSSLASTVAAQGDTITAQGEALTGVSAEVDEFSAEGLFRATVEATPAGALSRIALKAAATGEEDASSRAAALFLEAVAGDLSRVLVDADRFGVVNGASFGLVFEVSGGEVFIRNARIQNAAIDTLKIAGNAVTIPVYAEFPANIRPEPAPGIGVAYATIVREGFPTFITFGCQMGGLDYGEVLFRLRRNGVAIRDIPAGTGPAGASQSVFFQISDGDLGTGATVYRVDAIWQAGAQSFIGNRSLNLVQTKR